MSEPNNEGRPRTPLLRYLETVEQLSVFPDGTVVIWNTEYGREHERQAGVLDSDSDGERTIRPISIHVYESNTALADVTFPLWVVTFIDPRSLFTPLGTANVSDPQWIPPTFKDAGGPPWSGPAADAAWRIQGPFTH